MRDLSVFDQFGPIDVARILGLPLAPGARVNRAMTTCPVHGEKNASCSLTVGPRGSFRAHCFSCSATLDLLGFFAAVRGLDVRRDFATVVEEASETFGVSVGEDDVPATPRRRVDRIDAMADDWLSGRPWPSEARR